jgi:glycosyltransferase involved in cell wall biosynthesis
MALRLHSAEFSAALETLLRKQNFDIVQIEGIELAWTIPTIRKTTPDLPLVYDAHNAEALLQSRSGAADRGKIQRWPAAAYSRFQSSRLASYETWVCNTVDRVLAVSEADGEALQTLAGDKIKPITVVPNSIDVAAYRSAEKTVDRQYQFDIIFSGKMDYRPNVDAVLWFAENVWPLIKRETPDVTWAIVGQRPHARLAHLDQMPDVTITGWVRETKPYLFGAKVFVMPFRVGSGTRLKLIEALAAGKAVVSTPVGVEGFAVEDGRHLLLSDSVEGFAKSTVALLADSEQREFLGDQGMQFAQQYDWRVVVPRIQSVYDEIMAQKSLRNGAGTHPFEQ